MKVYFLSSQPCILTLNGAYYGTTDTFERFLELSPKDNLFVEFTPENGLPIRFFLNENLRFHPPKNCEVYLLKDGVAVYANNFPPEDFELKTFAQARNGKTLVTLFRQGPLQLSIESERGFFLSPLPADFANEPIEIFFYDEFILLRSAIHIALYDTSGRNYLLEKARDAFFDGGILKAELPLADHLNRVAKCKWDLSGGTCKQTEFLISQSTGIRLDFGADDLKNPQVGSERIRDELLPYAFFESVLLGANYKELLALELQNKADSLKSFLGEFTSVTLTEKPNVCGLIRKKAERLFEVDYYAVEIENGKITDVKSC